MKNNLTFLLLASLLLVACAWTPMEYESRARTEALNEFWGRR